MNYNDVTPLLITWNEAPNIRRTLEMLSWAKDIVIIDSGSTDETLDIVSRFPQARVVTRPFDSFAGQCNFGLAQVRTEWVLSLDADYVLTAELVAELGKLDALSPTVGWTARFIYCVHGRALRSALYPPRTVLYRRSQANYCDDGHGHRVNITGPTEMLEAAIHHDDRKSLSRWLSSQDHYARKEADKLAQSSYADLKIQDKLRKTMFAAIPATLIYTLVVKRALLDGWRGWYYTLQRTIAEVMLALWLLEKRFSDNEP